MQENCTLLGENLGYQSLGLVYGQLNLLLQQLHNTLRIPYISTVGRINDSWDREWIRSQQGGQLQCWTAIVEVIKNATHTSSPTAICKPSSI